ncbi:PAS domain-containing protein [Pelagibius sp.]|uniref:PAS domain-containing protein n=1 Tax=Pelagibius sp. TaxID=1931238 RepID=UPI00262E3CD4|nr:PAS domain-containing protein [Pelagibius sp.]
MTIDTTVQDTAERIAAYLTAEKPTLDPATALDLEINDLLLKLDPTEEDLSTTMHRVVLQYWRGLPRVKDVPHQVKVDPEALVPALGYLMLVDVVGGHSGFRYSLYGTKIARVAGFDMTGKTVWDIETRSAIQTFFAACYLAVIRLRRPLFTVHEAPPSITTCHWHRLLLPLGPDGRITRILVCNVPLHDGVPV